MNNKEIEKYIDKSGTKISKDRLMMLVQKTSDKEFVFAKDQTSSYALIKIKMN